MSGLKCLANLLLVFSGLWAAEGLLLQKQRPALLPDDNMRNSYEAADYFRQELTQHLLDESSRPGVTTPYPDDMHIGTTTEMPIMSGEIEMGSVPRGPDAEMKSKDSHLSVYPAKYVKGYLTRSSTSDPDLHDIIPLALSTLSDSTGIVVTQKKEAGSSIPTTTLRLFKTGGKTLRSCNNDDSSKPAFNAGCGDHYLFPGYKVKLVQGKVQEDCLWRFRHSAPEVLVTLNGVKRHHGMQMYIENAYVPTSLVVNSTSRGERGNHRSRHHSFRDLMITAPTEAEARGISIEVCVPASLDYEEYAEYETQEWQCCDNVPNPACGLPMGSLNDPKFSIDTMPWEVVVAVTVKSAEKDSYIVSYCSGALISADWVLTTSSCVLRPENEHPGSTPLVTVSFGDAAAPNAVKYAIKEFIVYPTATEDHDLALVKLAEKVRRRPVCLPGYSKPDLNADVIGKVGTVFGWVLDGAKKPYISTLQQKVIDSEECSLRQGKKLPPHLFCTVDSTHGKPCLADGHLLMGTQRFTLRGLSNPRLACKNDFRTHTSVAHFMPWISNVTGIVMPF